MESTEAEAAESSEKQVDAEDLRQVESRLAGSGVLPDLKIPISPVPDGGQHHQAGENDVSGSDALETPEAGINTRFTGDAPSTPAAGHAKAGHERHHEHALTPHRVQDRIRRIENGQLVESHGAGPAGYEGCMHEVHSQKAARVINDNGVHPIPGQSHGSGSGDKTAYAVRHGRS
ncbi:MAG: hypothetical protein CM15mP116_03450 [Synechococcus sp.]|nr:MAG: hypothetical protein CM15mP116_03450 [Synechococcus sp.]